MKTGSRARTLPRRRRPSLAARIRPFWIVAVAAAALVAWGSVTLSRSAWFRVTRIGIDLPLSSPVSRERVRAAAAIGRDANVWLLDTRAVARRIEAIPYVDRAEVHRGQFPQPFVELGITVRRPTACVRGGGREVTIDAAARVLQNGCPDTALPAIDAGAVAVAAPGATVTTPDVARLLADAKLLADAGVSARRLRRDRFGGLEAVDATGVTLEFGDDADLAAKAALVGPVRAGVGTRRPIRAIDLRSPRTPTVRFR